MSVSTEIVQLVYSVHGHAEGLVASGGAVRSRDANGVIVYEVRQ